MTLEIGALLILLGLALILFSLERLPADAIALGLLLALVIGGLLPTEKAFAGFGSDTVVMILGLLILTAALTETGAVELASRALLRHVGDRPERLVMTLMGAGAAFSAFMSNTGATAFFVPISLGLARRLRLNASRLLLPLAFASILASSVTLIGTSTNLVISGLLTTYNQPPLAMLELSPVGVPILIVGLIYMATIGRRLIPDRAPQGDPVSQFSLRPYLTEVLILDDSPLAGQTLAESDLGHELDLTVVRILRGGEQTFAPCADTVLQSGDLLLVEGGRDELLNLRATKGLELKPEVEISGTELESQEVGMFEVILLPRSPLIGRTLLSLNFRQRYGLQVLAINHSGQRMRRKLSQVRLYVGDQLLVQGARAAVIAMDEDDVFRLVGPVEHRIQETRRAPLAFIIFAISLILATLNILTLPVAVMLGALLSFLTRCITPEEAYRRVEWRALILIGSMLGFGAAMEHTGAAAYLAGQIASWLGDLPPVWVLGGFFLLAMVLTQPMSNQAAAVVVVPVAMQTALQLGLNPRAFAVMIAVGASCSFLTPLEPACLIIYGPGNYRFIDFLKVGMPLTVLIFVLAMILVPLGWPL